MTGKDANRNDRELLGFLPGVRSPNARVPILVFILLTGVAILMIATRSASAVNRTWDGGGADNNWSTAANWSDDTVPITGDVAVFDGTSTKDVTIDGGGPQGSNINLLGINISSGYTGTITQVDGVNLAVGNSGFFQAGGIFIGGSGNIDINGGFTLSGVSFTASSNTTSIAGFFARTGTFNDNGGTVVFDGAGNQTVGVNVSETFNNLTINKPSGTLFFTVGDTLITAGTLSLTDGVVLNATLEAQANVSVASTFDGGNTLLLITSNTGDPRTLTFNAGANLLPITLNAANVTINTAGTGTLVWRDLTLQAGTIQQGDVTFQFGSSGQFNGNYNQSGGTFTAGSQPITFGPNGGSFTLSNGTFTGGSGNIDINGGFTLSGGSFTASSSTTFIAVTFGHTSGGTFNHNGGTVVFDGANNHTVDVNISETFNHLTINTPGRTLFFTAGDTLITAGTLSLTDGVVRNDATLEAQGNVNVASTFDGSNNTKLSFTGTADQTYTNPSDPPNPAGPNLPGVWTVNKTAGSVTLASNLVLGTSQALNITAGTLDQGPSFNLQAGAITIGSAGVLRNFGTGDLTLGGNLTNNGGVVNLNGGGSGCGDPNVTDALQIRSTNTTIRTWSGNGIFSLVDVDVDRQAAGSPPTTINAFGSSVLGANMGTGWTTDLGNPNDCPVTITLQPTNQTSCTGGSASFSASANGATSFQWRKNSTPLSNGGNVSGSNTGTLTINPVGAGDQGNYDAVATSAVGITAISNSATLNIAVAPVITDGPDTASVCEGALITFTAVASGSGPLSFQWRKNLNPIPGATDSSFTLNSVASGDAGSYDVVVSGACTPPAVSQPATLTVNTVPAITQEPTDQTSCAGGSASFSVSASGTDLSFQWRRNGIPLSNGGSISGADTATLMINPVSVSDAALAGEGYDVIVTGTCSPAITSIRRALSVNTNDLSIAKSHIGDFTVGTNGVYSVAVTNVASCPTTGTITVTDTLPIGLSFVSGTGPGWTCSAVAQDISCANAGPLAPSTTSTITLTVGVDGGAVPSVTNTASVSTANDNNAGNNLASDPTAVNSSSSNINPGQLIIGEFRLRGPGPSPTPNSAQQAADEFIEVYNNTNSAITVQTTDGSSGFAVVAADGLTRFVIPNGTLIPARGHFLGVNSDGYSLSSYPAGNESLEGTVSVGNSVSAQASRNQLRKKPVLPPRVSNPNGMPGEGSPAAPTAIADATYTIDIPDNAGIALFRTASAASFTVANRLDAVGPNTEANTLFREGAGYQPLTSIPTGNHSFYRSLCSFTSGCTTPGIPKDTNDNAADFLYVSTDGADSGAGARLGAPGPENLGSPIRRDPQLALVLLDATKSASLPPNRVRDLTSDPTNNSTFGTLSVRRRIINSTGASVTRLRFRVVEITTVPRSNQSVADIRVRTSTLISAVSVDDQFTCAAKTPPEAAPCVVQVQGLTLEEPPNQITGGGFNSTLSATSITLATPLANGASVNVQFLLGVQQTGFFRFLIIIEALP